jgi:pimeloyl-ACP methyl ester carboxylesterase
VQKQTTLPETGETLSYLTTQLPAASLDGSQPNILLGLHGMTQDSTLFAPFLASLRLKNTQIIIPDLQGHGSRIPYELSRGDDYVGYTNEERSSDIISFLDSLNITDPVDIYGYSLGGGVGLALQSQHPTRTNKAALLSPACVLSEECLTDIQNDVIKYNYITIQEAESMLEVTGFHANTVKQRAPLLAYMRASTNVDINYWSKTFSSTANGITCVGLTIIDAQEDWTKAHALRCKENDKKCLVVQGTDDRIINNVVPGIIQEGYGAENCDVKWLEGVGHAGCVEDEKGYIAEKAARIVHEFFMSREATV